jgi:hypothetical protein
MEVRHAAPRGQRCVMISASDIIQVISETHQYSLLILELKGGGTFGIWHYPRDKVNYFKFEGKLGRQERTELVLKAYDDKMPESLVSLSVDEFLQAIQGKKARHIWLESREPERKELAFLSVSELRTFLKLGRSY